jgi:hypothetical protein
MAEQSLIRDHRASIALNNMGVSLLERRAYRQGVETLKDAIFVMMRVLRPSSRSQGTTSDSTTNDTEAKVHRAAKRLASPHAVPSALCIDAVSHGGKSSRHSSQDYVLSEASSSSPFTIPIRIEVDDLDYPEERDPVLESAIMLYNFGLAHLCMAKPAKSPIKLQEAALKHVKLAYAAVLSRLRVCEMHSISKARLLLAVLALENVVKVLIEMGKHSEANASYQVLVRLGRAIAEYQGRDPLETQVAAAAAA